MRRVNDKKDDFVILEKDLLKEIIYYLSLLEINKSKELSSYLQAKYNISL